MSKKPGKIRVFIKKYWTKFLNWKPVRYITGIFSARIGQPITYRAMAWYGWLHWKIIKRRAMRGWANTGIQHHVIPNDHKSIIIINNRWRKWYNTLPNTQKLDGKKVLEMSYFSTPLSYRNKEGKEKMLKEFKLKLKKNG